MARLKLSDPSQPIYVRTVLGIYEFFASLKLAVDGREVGSPNGSFYTSAKETYPGKNVYAYAGAWANGETGVWRDPLHREA